MIVVPSESGPALASTTSRVVSAFQACAAPGRIGVLGGLALVGIVAVSAVATAPHAVFLAVSGGLLVIAAMVDVHELRLPNRLLAASAGSAVVGSLLSGRPGSLGACALSGALCGVAVLTVHLTRGVGMGDVKAAAVVGMGCGSVTWMLGPIALAMALVCAPTTGLLTRRSRLALGPFLAVGWVVALGSKGWWTS